MRSTGRKWHNIRVDFEKTIAICEEGEINQYKAAPLNGVSDILGDLVRQQCSKAQNFETVGNK